MTNDDTLRDSLISQGFVVETIFEHDVEVCWFAYNETDPLISYYVNSRRDELGYDIEAQVFDNGLMTVNIIRERVSASRVLDLLNWLNSRIEGVADSVGSSNDF